jgi:hypothetical protein
LRSGLDGRERSEVAADEFAGDFGVVVFEFGDQAGGGGLRAAGEVDFGWRVGSEGEQGLPAETGGAACYEEDLAVERGDRGRRGGGGHRDGLDWEELVMWRIGEDGCIGLKRDRR